MSTFGVIWYRKVMTRKFYLHFAELHISISQSETKLFCLEIIFSNVLQSKDFFISFNCFSEYICLLRNFDIFVLFSKYNFFKNTVLVANSFDPHHKG